MEKKKCKYCGGKGFIQIAPNVKGMKPCPYCRKENVKLSLAK